MPSFGNHLLISSVCVAILTKCGISLSHTLICLLVFITLRFTLDVHSMMSPTKFVDLSTKAATRRFMAVRNMPSSCWPLQQEVRPITDAALHVLLFQWQIFGISSKIFGRILQMLNSGYDAWDLTFEERRQNSETEVLKYCRKYGISLDEWPWSKPASEYKTMNEWFGRSYREGILPSVPLNQPQLVVAPATAVVTTFKSVSAMPQLVKNDRFSIQGVVPESHLYISHSCALHYLSPADYHCYHAPISGKIVALNLLTDQSIPYSVTVKKYIFQHVNILKRNRRAVLVIERQDGFRCAMVVIGGITVDSIRLEPGIQLNGRVFAGQKVGAFARGGSSIALFFSRSVSFCHPGHDHLAREGLDYKVSCNSPLCLSL